MRGRDAKRSVSVVQGKQFLLLVQYSIERLLGQSMLMPSRILWKGKAVKGLRESRYYRHRLFLWKRPFHSFKSQQGGNYARVQSEKAYHINL
jgi:hypothetical protein